MTFPENLQPPDPRSDGAWSAEELSADALSADAWSPGSDSKSEPDGTWFEGTEKKLEFVLAAGSPSLRGLGEATWRDVVGRAGATILSRIESAHADAYLLSESSLFVFDHRALLITCGQTLLIAALEAVLERVDRESITGLVYERKSELFPHHQGTSFLDDAGEIARLFPGRALRFGDADSHHMDLWLLDPGHGPRAAPRARLEGGRGVPGRGEISTLEVLLHDLPPATREVFCLDQGAHRESCREWLGLERWFRVPECDLVIDDHLFAPLGYSLNALVGDNYAAIHVTPQRIGSYGSFETRRAFADSNAISDLIAEIVVRFRPRAFDVALFTCESGDLVAPRGYREQRRTEERTRGDSRVRFFSYVPADLRISSAIELPVDPPGSDVLPADPLR